MDWKLIYQLGNFQAGSALTKLKAFLFIKEVLSANTAHFFR